MESAAATASVADTIEAVYRRNPGSCGGRCSHWPPMDRELTLRRARPSEGTAVRELIARSMGHWDRPPAYLAEAVSLMSLSGEDIQRDEAWVLDDGAQIVGFVRVSAAGADAEIEELHLEPAWIGRGLGRRLFERAWRRRGRWEPIGLSGRPIGTRSASTSRWAAS